ncbi:hypothetical protein HDV05_000899 [Chytridiales sp. JEL 0842]|nr:hypothetical protein HDV05_000899 [Chytridiales sp. JEL 0842]
MLNPIKYLILATIMATQLVAAAPAPIPGGDGPNPCPNGDTQCYKDCYFSGIFGCKTGYECSLKQSYCSQQCGCI